MFLNGVLQKQLNKVFEQLNTLESSYSIHNNNLQECENSTTEIYSIHFRLKNI